MGGEESTETNQSAHKLNKSHLEIINVTLDVMDESEERHMVGILMVAPQLRQKLTTELVTTLGVGL